MPLKLTVTDLGEVSEPLRSAYRPRNDGSGYILDVEGGAVAKSVHDEFRNRNVELMKKLKDLGDLTPEGVSELTEKVKTLETELQAARTGKNADVEARIKAVAASADGYKARLESVMIDQAITRVAGSVGALPGAIDDVSTRIRARFKLGRTGSRSPSIPRGTRFTARTVTPCPLRGLSASSPSKRLTSSRRRLEAVPQTVRLAPAGVRRVRTHGQRAVGMSPSKCVH